MVNLSQTDDICVGLGQLSYDFRSTDFELHMRTLEHVPSMFLVSIYVRQDVILQHFYTSCQ